MSPGNRVRLLTLADRGFRPLTEERPMPPSTRKFKPIRLNAARFDRSWDRTRDTAVRLPSVLLREDDVKGAKLCIKVLSHTLWNSTVAGVHCMPSAARAYAFFRTCVR
jgi:hypothetical protein